jgi:hypothetical protein
MKGSFFEVDAHLGGSLLVCHQPVQLTLRGSTAQAVTAWEGGIGATIIEAVAGVA